MPDNRRVHRLDLLAFEKSRLIIKAMVTMPAPQSWPRRVLGFIVGEFLGALPAMLFFAVGFNIVVLSMNLIVDDYLIRFGSFMTATAAALIVGKAVLVANHARFISRFDRSPLTVPIFFKTIIYWLARISHTDE